MFEKKKTTNYVLETMKLFDDARVASVQAVLLRAKGEHEEAEHLEKEWIEFLTSVRDRAVRSLEYNFDKD